MNLAAESLGLQPSSCLLYYRTRSDWLEKNLDQSFFNKGSDNPYTIYFLFECLKISSATACGGYDSMVYPFVFTVTLSPIFRSLYRLASLT